MPIWDAALKTDGRYGQIETKPDPFFSLAESLLFTPALKKIYGNARRRNEKSFLEALLAEMRVRIEVTTEDLSKIPATGPVLVVSNHPFGILDGVALAATLQRIRPDAKILANHLLQRIPELEPNCIFVDPFNRKNSRQSNASGLKRAIAHLRSAGMVAVFPAGEVSHWQPHHGEVTDPEWSQTVTRLGRITGATVLPVLFLGRNSFPYHALGMIHPLIRTLQLPQEFVNKAGNLVELRIGAPIPAERICRIRDDAAATRYLRWHTYLLRKRGQNTGRPAWISNLRPVRRQPNKPVAGETPLWRLQAELEELRPEQIIQETPDYKVLVTEATQSPWIIDEIGRLRELTFRHVGEGTGKERDLDAFDEYYKHLVLWHKEGQRIAGAYRFGNTQQILESHGIQGLYTSTLFNYHPQLFARLGPALELGRSFIRVEYQKHYAPLLMLWKGVAQYVAAHPETPVLFGAVSMSNGYQRSSRELLVQFFQSQPAHPLAQWVKPRCMLRAPRLRSWELETMREVLDMDEVSDCIAHLEQDGKGIPVLLRQYLKLGGELLGFNVDRNFSDVLDGLIVVDLRKTDRSRLATYMGKQGLASFHRYHAAGALQEEPSTQLAV